MLALIGFTFFCFTSCEDPYSNQTVATSINYSQGSVQDTTYLLAPAMASVKLSEATAADSTEILTVTTGLTLLDPAAKVTYQLQLSGSKNFLDTVVIELNFSGKTGSKVKILNSTLNIAIDKLLGTDAASIVYARVLATITRNGTIFHQLSKADTNGAVATFSVTPYPLVKPYTVYAPRLWYLVGSAIGDGSWNNSLTGLGSALYPLNVISGNVYNKNGDGIFTYTGYFLESKEFKLIRDLGNWDEQWGMSGSNYVHNEGGAGNIKVAVDGWYTITLNSIKNTLTIVSAAAPSTSYNSMGLIGDFNGWGTDIAMIRGASTNSHIWYTTYTFLGDATQGLKFRANGGWDVNWGGVTFPTGIGPGENIMYKAGTYTAVLNDLSGVYYFIKH